jgi:hypothetical protein
VIRIKFLPASRHAYSLSSTFFICNSLGDVIGSWAICVTSWNLLSFLGEVVVAAGEIFENVTGSEMLDIRSFL